MIALQASGITKMYGSKTILESAGLTLRAGERACLVGPNGAGKTTLLKILVGEIEPDQGEVTMPANTSLGYLPQGGGFSSGATVMEEMLSACRRLIEQEEALGKLERQMGESRVMEDPRLFSQVSEEYSLLLEDFRNRGGYEFRANIRAVLSGLNFGEEYYSQVVDTLSGGQKTRLAMARLLAARPDVLVLDEPTNHLDLQTLAWMEKYLQSYRGAILVVSHDRYFLDSLVGAVYELVRGTLRRYTGNYSSFITLRAARAEAELKQYQKQQDEIARTEDFIRRNIARASTTGRAQSRRKALERVKLVEKPKEHRSARFFFTVDRPGSREVLNVKNLSVGYPGTVLARGIDLKIERGDRVALIGPNGSGKTTFLKTVAGLLRPLGGHLFTGANVSIGYYDQEQARLSGSRTVLDELWDRFPHMDEKDVRGLLGSFLFSGDDVFKTVDQLSGGEKSRLALALLMLKRANFLILDEPTNHLDVYSREVLEEALSGYGGSILFVSHDRYFLNKLAARIIEITPSGLTAFTGNYDDYQAQKPLRPGQAQNSGPAGTQEKDQARLSYRLEKEALRQREKMERELSSLEEAIGAAEAEIAALAEETYSPEVYQNLELLLQKNTRLEDLKGRLESLYRRWELLMDDLGR